MVHVPEILGTFYRWPATVSGSDNKIVVDRESMAARLHWLARPPYAGDPAIRKAVARQLFANGYQYVTRGEPASAREFLRAAWRLDHGNLAFLKTYLLRGVLRV